jgi:hypothetical protein
MEGRSSGSNVPTFSEKSAEAVIAAKGEPTPYKCP